MVHLERFGEIVPEPELIQTGWPDGATNQSLRVHVSRLRQRIAPLGLKVTCVRGSGYVMTDNGPHAAPVTPTRPPEPSAARNPAR